MNDPTPEENAPERPNPPDGSRKQFRPLRAVKPKLIAVLWVAFLAPEIGNTEVSSNLPKPGEARMIHFEGALPKVKAKSAELHYEFDLAKETFEIFVPKNYSGEEPHSSDNPHQCNCDSEDRRSIRNSYAAELLFYDQWFVYWNAVRPDSATCKQLIINRTLARYRTAGSFIEGPKSRCDARSLLEESDDAENDEEKSNQSDDDKAEGNLTR